MLVALRGFPLEQEIERIVGRARVVVPAAVRRELDALRDRGVTGAAVAASLAERYPTVPGPGRGDPAILALARAHRASVVTADLELAERLRAAGSDVLVPRDRQRLVRRAGRALRGPAARAPGNG